MKKVLEKFSNNKEISNGLLLIDMPTGTGKTYRVAEYIANNYDKIDGKIFFVTQLKKNLPEDDIRRCFRNIGKEDEVDKILLRVENNVDNLCANFDSVKKELYEYIGDKVLLVKIEREIKLINGNKGINDDNMFLVQQARDDLQNELERELRNKVTAYLAYNEKGIERTKSQKKKLLENDNSYKWITRLYPATQTYNKKIFLMSLDKFLYRYSTIVEPPFNLYESDLLNNGLVFIDEFDSTKEVILRKIINDGLDNQFGIIDLFREIYVGLFNPEFTNLLIEESKYIKEYNTNRQGKKRLKTPKQILASLKRSANKLYNGYKFVFQFKVHDDSKEGTKFLFQDYKTHSIVDGKLNYLYLEEDKQNKVNWIKVGKSEKEVSDIENAGNEKTTNYKNIYSLINEVQGFLREFQTGIRFIADNYYHLREERGKEEFNISSESSIRTVLAEFGIEGKYQNYLTLNILSNAKRHKFDWKQLSDILDASVYENGFRYYHLVDSDNHDTLSKINYVAFNDSPEKFLCRLINRTKVIGISATATLPTPLSNYDLNYLKCKCKDLIFEFDDTDKERFKNYFNSYTEHYDRVKIESKPLGYIENLSEGAKKDYEFYADQLSGVGRERDYIKQRFLCFAEAVEFFFKKENIDIKSFLYFANSKGGEYYVDGYNVLFELFKKLQIRHKVQAELIFLHGNIDEFESKKEKIQAILSEGKKVFVITTYSTMGAGQNIHYEYDFNSGNIFKVNNLSYNLNKKDFDAIYLEKPSHILVDNFNRIDNDEDFVKYIYQIKFLQEAGDYRPFEIIKKVCVAFKNRESGKGYDYIGNRHTKNFLFAYAKVAQQAIGRICRTANKNKNIYVFYQKELEEFIAPIADYYEDKLINPEFKSFLDSCRKGYGSADIYDNKTLQSLAETKDERAKQYKEAIRCVWNKSKVDRWERIREEVLKRPTISNLSETEFPELYIELPCPNNKYYVVDKNYPHEDNAELFKYSFNERLGYKCVDASYVLLPSMLKIPGVKEYFINNKYATCFEANKFMLSESILKSIYQGALGEFVGRFIVDKQLLNILNFKFECLPIETYEKFDNKIKNIYFDFKNWNGSSNPSLQSKISHIRDKMKLTRANKLVIVNILKPKLSVKPYLEGIEGAMLVLPYLYDIDKSEWNYKGLKKLYDILVGLK